MQTKSKTRRLGQTEHWWAHEDSSGQAPAFCLRRERGLRDTHWGLLDALWDGAWRAPSSRSLSISLLLEVPSFFFFKSRFSVVLKSASTSCQVFAAATSNTSPWPGSSGLWGFLLQDPQGLEPAEKEFLNGHHLLGTARGNRPGSSVILGKKPISF